MEKSAKVGIRKDNLWPQKKRFGIPAAGDGEVVEGGRGLNAYSSLDSL